MRTRTRQFCTMSFDENLIEWSQLWSDRGDTNTVDRSEQTSTTRTQRCRCLAPIWSKKIRVQDDTGGGRVPEEKVVLSAWRRIVLGAAPIPFSSRLDNSRSIHDCTMRAAVCPKPAANLAQGQVLPTHLHPGPSLANLLGHKLRCDVDNYQDTFTVTTMLAALGTLPLNSEFISVCCPRSWKARDKHHESETVDYFARLACRDISRLSALKQNSV
jgi:hypothetical protein